MSGVQVRHMAIFLILISYWNAWAQPGGDTKPVRHHFRRGEQLEFKLSYGWFTVGKADVKIDPEYHTYEKKECFKVDVTGVTAGLIGLFTNVNDSWGAYVTKDHLTPLHAYRDIQEGKHVRVERTYFNHEEGKVTVHRYDPRKEHKDKPPRIYDAPRGVKDLMSAYLYLRNIDFSKYSSGDTITIDTFYEDELYHFKLLLDETEMYDSRVGEIRAHKLYLLIPPSDLFPKEKGIMAWVSADPNHLPLRIEAEMFFGRAYCDLISYRNIKYGPDYQ